MFNQYLYFVCGVLVLRLAESAPPQGLDLCKTADSECNKQAATKYKSIFADGIPEYGIDSFNPLFLKSVNASDGNLLFLLSDVIVNGMKDCVIKKLEVDPSKSQMAITIQCTATLDGNYVMKGSVLVVPIEGNGKIHVDLNAAIFNLLLTTIEKIGTDGKSHWHIKSYDHSFELKKKSNVVFENLFNGNKVLGEAVELLIKDHSNEVITEIGSKFIEYVINVIVKNVNRLFKAVPKEDLTLS